MSSRVDWAESALADLESQVLHISANDPEAAERIAAAIRKTGNSLGEFATGHPGRMSGTYEKSVRRLPYIIAYALSDDDRAVSILRVIHTSRDWHAEAWPD